MRQRVMSDRIFLAPLRSVSGRMDFTGPFGLPGLGKGVSNPSPMHGINWLDTNDWLIILV